MKKSIILLTLLFCLNATSLFAQNGIETNVKFPFSSMVFDCDQEQYMVTGTAHLKSNVNGDKISFLFDFHGTGIKESTGDPVQVNSWEHHKFNNEPLPFTTHIKMYYHVIVKGKTPNFKWIRYAKIHINKNGVVTFEDEGDEIICNN